MKPEVIYRPKRRDVPSSTKPIVPAAPAKSATAPKAGRKSTPKPLATVTPIAAQPAMAGTSETAPQAKRNRKKPFATIVETFRTKITVPEAMEVVTKLARPELEAIALEYVIDRARKQKQKAKWQKKWREKANKK